MKIVAIIPLIAVVLLMAGCGGHGVVESGTYTGTISKVEPEKLEIYVQLENGPEVELYFKDFTTLTRGDAPAEFSALTAGQKVEVEVKKTGKRMDPLRVKILP